MTRFRSLPFVSDIGLTLGTAAALTLSVRALGLLTQRVILGELGTSAMLDGYFIALVLPAMLVTPAGTALEMTLVPTIARLQGGDADAERAIAGRAVRRGIAAAALVAVSSFMLIEPLVFLSAPAAGIAQQNAAEIAARWVFPAIGAQIITAICRSIMYGRGQFNRPIAIGILNPIFMLVFLLVRADFGVEAVAQASAAGFVAEALVLLWMVRNVLGATGQSKRLAPLSGELLPVLLAQIPLRAVFYVDQVFASGLEEGALARFSIALRLYDAAAAILVLPNARMASVRVAKAAAEDIGSRCDIEFRRALKVGFVAAVLFAGGSPAVVYLALANGAFVGGDVRSTVLVTLTFALIVPTASTVHVGFRSVIAMGKTWMVVRLAIAELVANVLLNAAFAPLFGAPGIVLATGIAHAVLTVAQRRILRPGERRDDQS